MLTISDNAATDVVLEAIGIDAVNKRLVGIGCDGTIIFGSIATMIDGFANDLRFEDYEKLLAAKRGAFGEAARKAATDGKRIATSRVLDPLHRSNTTARDATGLLRAVWSGTAASEAACDELQRVMEEQVTRRLAAAVAPGGTLAAKSGALFGGVRNEIGVIDVAEEHFAFARVQVAHEPFQRPAEIDRAMARAVSTAIRELSA